jgi:hypothetical protein
MAERGRPSIFSEELAARICERLAAGETLRAICRDDGMPAPSTVIGWTYADEAFSEQYAKARQHGYQFMADELLEIADDGSNDWMERQDGENAGYQFNGEHFQRSRLRVDTRKWLLSKALPKVYGDRQTHEVELSANAQLLALIEGRMNKARGAA